MNRRLVLTVTALVCLLLTGCGQDAAPDGATPGGDGGGVSVDLPAGDVVGGPDETGQEDAGGTSDRWGPDADEAEEAEDDPSLAEQESGRTSC